MGKYNYIWENQYNDPCENCNNYCPNCSLHKQKIEIENNHDNNNFDI